MARSSPTSVCHQIATRRQGAGRSLPQVVDRWLVPSLVPLGFDPASGFAILAKNRANFSYRSSFNAGTNSRRKSMISRLEVARNLFGYDPETSPHHSRQNTQPIAISLREHRRPSHWLKPLTQNPSVTIKPAVFAAGLFSGGQAFCGAGTRIPRRQMQAHLSPAT